MGIEPAEATLDRLVLTRHEWEAWRDIVRATDGLDLDFDSLRLTPLVKAIKAWGEAYHRLMSEYGE